MQASIQTLFTWSQERILAGGAKKIVLLVEWKGALQGEDSRKKSRKVVARDIEPACLARKSCQGNRMLRL